MRGVGGYRFSAASFSVLSLPLFCVLGGCKTLSSHLPFFLVGVYCCIALLGSPTVGPQTSYSEPCRLEDF